MKVLIKDVANFYDYNPDEMTSFVNLNPEKYGGTEGSVETAKIDRSAVEKLIIDWGFANRAGHNWREFVKENLYEDEVSSEVPVTNDATDIETAQKIANGQAALNREDLKLQQLKDRMIPINKKKAQIQKAMIKIQADNAQRMKARAKEQAKQQKEIIKAQQAQQQQPAAPVATPVLPTTESLLQNDLDRIELLEDYIVVLMQEDKPNYKKINELIEEFKPKILKENDNPMSIENFYNLSEEKKTEELDDDFLFYIKAYDEDDWFIGKIFKISADEDWYGIVKAGENDTFDKISYDPEFDEEAIVDFLRDTYDSVEIIDQAEYDDYAEEEPNDIDETGITGMHL